MHLVSGDLRNIINYWGGRANGATVGLIGRSAACEPAARQVVQVPGNARFLSLSLRSQVQGSRSKSGASLLRHADALHGQVMQVAACNVLHSAEARLARFTSQ
jgi:hypothetical protein